MIRIKKKILVFLISLFSVFLLLEAGLRIISGIYLMKFHSKQDDLTSGKSYDYCLLCLGDSFTQGMGAVLSESYPMQLQKLLNSEDYGKRFKVVNKAIGGCNTAQVLYDLQNNIDKFNPDLIILLIGFNNDWNYWGYHDYIIRERNYRVPFGVKNMKKIFFNQLYTSRVYKLLKILCVNLRNKFKPQAVDKNEYSNLMKNDFPTVNNSLSAEYDGWNYMDRGKYKEAIAWFKSELNNGSSNKIYYEGIGNSYYEIGQYSEAIKWLYKYLDVNSQDAQVIGRIGWAYLEQSKYNEAIDLFIKAIKIKPEDSSFYNGMGEVYYNLREYDRAIEWFNKGISINPKDNLNYSGIAQCYLDQGHSKEAIEWFKKAIEINPNDGDNYFGIADTLVQNKQYQEAIEWFNKTVEVDPCNLLSFRYIANFYKMQGKYEEGIEFLMKKKRINPEVESLIDMLKNRGDIDDKIDLWMESDIEEMIRICRENGINTILQNYPSNIRLVTSDILKRVADRSKVPFVDNNKIFNELLMKGETKENLFAGDGNHPNAGGYEIMAKNLYDKIVEEGIYDYHR